ncbi:hypothetical protein SETIT_7G046800v2 [Setaria italica]|uniref:Uncharacterized protein n=1 Tax=Setaria italica TaxID=4555 RepID=A0A368RRX0_SETIT|nr:hypothetical protein SETIT_7G046800v2 [Setaria italica]
MSHRKRLRRIGDGAATVPVTPETEEEDTRALLGQIHGFYRAALDRLPAEEIPSLAPRLLSASVCFGVLDPASNIIANAVSYSPTSRTPTDPDDEYDEEKAAPAAQLHTREAVLSRIVGDPDVISPEAAERMTLDRRSLDGLPETEALRYLRLAGADLLAAVRLILLDRNSSVDPPQDGKPGFSVISLTTEVALGCAAVSAKHPEPTAFVRASRLLAARLDDASMVLPVVHQSRPISSANLKRLGKLLKRKPRNMKKMKRKLEKLVNAALNNYSKKNRGHFEVHVICGVNPNVSEGARSHINFWATPKGSDIAGTTPLLFFAECSNDADEEEESMCFSVYSASIDSVRCFDCEYYVIKVVHPCDEGVSWEWRGMARGEHSISNELIISACQFHVEMVYILDEDWNYFDSKLDAKIAERNSMEMTVRIFRMHCL